MNWIFDLPFLLWITPMLAGSSFELLVECFALYLAMKLAKLADKLKIYEERTHGKESKI